MEGVLQILGKFSQRLILNIQEERFAGRVLCFIDAQGRLVYLTVIGNYLRLYPPQEFARFLVSLVELHFGSYREMLYALGNLSIFDGLGEPFEVRLEDCYTYCDTIVESAEERDPVGGYFLRLELNRVISKLDDGSGSYLLHQAGAMAESLKTILWAFVFIHEAFQACYALTAPFRIGRGSSCAAIPSGSTICSRRDLRISHRQPAG